MKIRLRWTQSNRFEDRFVCAAFEAFHYLLGRLSVLGLVGSIDALIDAHLSLFGANC
jgi:hypothetical protein